MQDETATHAHCCSCNSCTLQSQNAANAQAQRSPGVEYTFSMDLSGTMFDGDLYELQQFEQAVREAFATWEAVANVSFTEISVADAASAPADTHIFVETTSDPVEGFDGEENQGWGEPGGIIGLGGNLGDAQDNQGFAWMDDAEMWSPYGDEYSFSYWVVAAHEIGHALGLNHDDNGLQLMNAFIGDQEGLYQGDIDAITSIYGVREWTDAGEEVFLTYVKVGQTVDARGGNDTIYATTLADTIYGGSGNDTIEASDGNDRIYDTLGINTVDAGNNNDLVVGGAGQTDALGGSGNDILIGGKGDDTLNGGLGSDTIRGDASSSFFHGDDTLTAGRGTDFLEGGGGADTFVFTTNEGVNTIAELSINAGNPSATRAIGVDFESGVDVIELNGFGYSSAAQAFSQVTDVGGQAQFSDRGTTIVFHGLTKSDLSEDDFWV